MNKQENFTKRVYEIVSELKLPLIDDRVQDNVKFKSNNATVIVKFVFEEDESIIRGFLGLAEYFHTVIIKKKINFTYLMTINCLLWKAFNNPFVISLNLFRD